MAARRMLAGDVPSIAVPEPFELVTLPWEAQPGRWSLSICLRATFALHHGAPCEPLEPVSTTHTIDGSWDEANEKIQHLSDLVPFKPRADVLVIGHAFAPWGVPVRALIARLRVGELTKAVRVVGDRTWRWVGGRWVVGEARPFTSKALRWEGAARNPLVPVGLDTNVAPVEGCPAAPTFETHLGAFPGLGPIPPGWPQRYGLVDESSLEWALGFAGGGPVAGGAPPQFPFAFFNVAPADQQVDLLRPGAPLVLEHLSADQPMIATHLPSARPRASRRGADGRRSDIALRCDTLWINADRATCTMLWRGLTDIAGPTDHADLTFTVEGLSRGRAMAVPAAAQAPAPNRLEQTQDVPLEAVDQAFAALPFGAGGRGGELPDELTSALGDEGSTTHAGDRARPERNAQETGAPPPRVGSIPDVQPPPRLGSIPDVQPPPRVGSMPDVEPPARLGSLPDAEPRPRLGSLADAAPAPVRLGSLAGSSPLSHLGGASEGVPPARPGSLPDIAPPARLGSIVDSDPTDHGDPPDEAVAAEPVDPETVDLVTSARIAATLALPGADRAKTLSARGLDDATWSKLDRRWKQAIDQDSRGGSTAMLESYDDAFLEGLEAATSTIGVAEYARITASKKRGDLADVLTELKFPRVELLRLTRVWTRRTKADPALAKALEEAIERESKK